MKKLVFVSTPFHAETVAEMQENIHLAQRICKKVMRDGYIPYAPHLLFPQFLDDADARQRKEGITAGIECCAGVMPWSFPEGKSQTEWYRK